MRRPRFSSSHIILMVIDRIGQAGAGRQRAVSPPACGDLAARSAGMALYVGVEVSVVRGELSPVQDERPLEFVGQLQGL
jgi:hypothetical protein